MNNKKALVILNTITLLIMLFANYAAGSGVLTEVSVADVSYRYDTLFTPAGYAFSIWGLIFLLCIAFVIYQWKLLKDNDQKGYIGRSGLWFAVSNIANTAWLFCWTNDMIGPSVIIILILLLALCMLTIKLRLELDDEPVQTILFVWWPVSIYLGWVMVATVANIAAYLVSINWRGGNIGEDTWTIIMIAIATLLYLGLIKTRNLREAAAIGMWAFIAISVRQWTAQNNIAVTALAATIILFIATAIHAYKNRHFNMGAKLKRKEWKG